MIIRALNSPIYTTNNSVSNTAKTKVYDVPKNAEAKPIAYNMNKEEQEIVKFLQDKPLVAYRYQRLLENSPEAAAIFMTSQKDLGCYGTGQTVSDGMDELDIDRTDDEVFFTQMKKYYPEQSGDMEHTTDGFRQALNQIMSDYYNTVTTVNTK